MENFQGNYSKVTKIKVPPGMKTQKLIIGSGRYHSNSVSPASFDSENVDLNAPILRYLCGGSPIAGKLAPRGSRSPLSAVENLIERSPPPREVYRTPVKAVEGEEVLVMDGVPLKRSTRFSGSESSGSSGKSLFKAEILQSPEDSGKCRYSSTCKFARGKEDDHPIRLSIKNKTEPQLSRSYDNSPGLGAHNPNPIFLPQVVAPTSPEVTMPPDRASNRPKAGKSILISSSATPFIPAQRASHAAFQMSALAAPFIPGQTPAPAIPETPTSQMSTSAAPCIPAQTPKPATSVTSIPRTMSAYAAPFIPHQRASLVVPVTPVRIASTATFATPNRPASPTTASRNAKSTLTTAEIWSDWLPQDDGIEVTLPFSAPGSPPSRESMNNYIDKVLSGVLKTRRLPVFSEIYS